MAEGDLYYFLYEKNLQGDIVAIYNIDGERLVSYKYDAWGNVSVTNRNISGTNAGAQYNPFRYRGYYYDEEVGLYYLNSRYYDPRTGRFLNADDTAYLGADGTPLSYNLFAYCMNNPINYFDDNGNWSMPNWLKLTIGAAALTGAIALTVATGGGAAAVAIGVAKIVGSVVLSTAISAGIGYLENGEQGAIDGACNGFMFGSLSALGGSVLKYAKVHSATNGTSNSIGQAGEKMSGIVKNKESYYVNGRWRIPDGITKKYVQEVKNVKRLSYTSQLKDSIQLASDMGKKLQLFVRPNTYLSAPLKQAIKQYGVKVTYLW